MPYHDELARLLGGTCRFHYGDTAGHADFDSLLRSPPDDTQVYVCGPQGMIAAVQVSATRLDWAPERVRSDSEPQFDLNFAPDKPGLMMRQVLYRLAAAEAGVAL